MPPSKKLDLNIEVDVLTSGSTADVVNAILEFLLFQRNQIPFVYNTYKYYVGLWAENSETNTDVQCVIQTRQESSKNPLLTFQLERQREQAHQTKDAISSMRTLIKNLFEKNTVRSLRFLFGSTTFTAKEAYTIHIPIDSISPLHFHNQHRIPCARLNQTLISLLTSEDLYSTFSNNLSPTNLYLEIEILCEPENLQSTYTNVQLLPKDVCQLPPSCKDIHFYLHHTPRAVIEGGALALNCCKELEIFEGIISLNLNQDERKVETLSKEEKESTSTWWEADILVRGFKDKPIKGLNIWTK